MECRGKSSSTEPTGAREATYQAQQNQQGQQGQGLNPSLYQAQQNQQGQQNQGLNPSFYQAQQGKQGQQGQGLNPSFYEDQQNQHGQQGSNTDEHCLLPDLNHPPESSDDDEGWSLGPNETIHYDWSNEYVEYDQVIQWFEHDSDNENEPDNEHEPDIPHEVTGTQATSEQRVRKFKVLKNAERNRVAAILLVHSHNCTKLPYGMINELAKQFGVSRHTIQRIWRQAKKQYNEGQEVNVYTKKAGRVGRKRIRPPTQRLTQVPLRKRTTLRSLAAALNMCKSTLHKMVKRGEIRSHTNPMKPELTFTHKYERMKWCVQSIIPATITTMPQFNLLQNVIHVDEKWFFMSKLTEKYYLSPEECDPFRACRSKRFLLKIMFLAALARPLYNENGELIWDGKIGIFPFTYKEPAKRSSKNRLAGTMETKALQSINQDVMRHKFIHELLPAIKEKWPRQLTTTVWIQQDNAKPHIMGDDAEFIEACKEGGLDIKLINQPAQSPDLNVLDLGFFRAIQSIKDQAAPKSVDELVSAVEVAFYDYSPKLTNYIFLTLNQCMAEIMKVKGGNNYKIPHMSKESLERQGLLPKTVEVSPELVQASTEWLSHGYLLEEEYILSISRRQNQTLRGASSQQQ